MIAVKAFSNSHAKEGTKASMDGGTSGPKAFLDQWFSKVNPKAYTPADTIMQTDSSSTNVGLTRGQEGGPGSGQHKGTGSKAIDDRNAQRDKDNNSKRYAKVMAPKNGSLKHESKKPTLRESIKFKSGKFLEAFGAASSADATNTRFKTIMLVEGLGNFRDGYYYSRDALISAVPIFEGAKIYADHPSSFDEQTRPERSVRDILGHFENVHIEEANGQGMMVGEVVIPLDEPFLWARSLMGHAVDYAMKYPDKDLVGLSINASGDATEITIDDLMITGVPEAAQTKLAELKLQGSEVVKLVTVIAEATSCDLVTEAGAGGKILELLEGDMKMAIKKQAKTKESEAKKEEGKEAAPAAAGADDGTAGDTHDDADQDKELIKKMIAKYLGADELASEDECGMVKQAYEACMEMGMPENEACETAVKQLKLAKHMASKAPAAPAEPAGGPPAAAGHADGEAVEAEPQMQAEEGKGEESHKEANIKLTAKVAMLEGKLKQYETKTHLEKILEGSKLPRAATNTFRDLVKDAKSSQEIDKSFKIFESAFKSQGAVGVLSFDGVFVQPEKTTQSGGGKPNLFDGVHKK